MGYSLRGCKSVGHNFVTKTTTIYLNLIKQLIGILMVRSENQVELDFLSLGPETRALRNTYLDHR